MSTKEDLEFVCENISNVDAATQMIEECSELQQALTKYLRLTVGNNPPKDKNLINISNNLDEECADVLVAMQVLKEYEIIDMCEIEKIAEHKLKRWANRLNGDWSE